MASTNALLPPSLKGKLMGSEKITGGIVGTLLLVGGVAALGWYVVPILTKIVTNFLYLGLASLALGGLVAAVFHPGTRSLVSTGFAVFIRGLHGQIIKRRPYDVARYIISHAKKAVESMQEHLGRLLGSTHKLKATRDRHAAKIEDAKLKIKAARQIGKGALADSQARQIGLLEASVTKLQKQIDFQEKLSAMLQKGKETAEIKIGEREQAMEIEIETHAALTEANAAAKDALSAIYGDSQKRELFDAAMNEIASQSAYMLGEIEQIMIDIKPVIDDAELGKLVDTERGYQALEAFEQRAQNLALSSVPERISIPDDEREPVTVGASRKGAPAASEFSSLFGDKKN